MIYNHYYVVEITEYTNLETGEYKDYDIYVNIKTNLNQLTHDLEQELILNLEAIKKKYNNDLIVITNIGLVKEGYYFNVSLYSKYIIEYYIKKKLYYVNEQLLDSIGDYLSVSEYKNLRVYEIIDGEFKEFYNTEYSYDESCVEVLKEYLTKISYSKELDEYTFDENDYEFIEL